MASVRGRTIAGGPARARDIAKVEERRLDVAGHDRRHGWRHRRRRRGRRGRRGRRARRRGWRRRRGRQRRRCRWRRWCGRICWRSVSCWRRGRGISRPTANVASAGATWALHTVPAAGAWVGVVEERAVIESPAMRRRCGVEATRRGTNAVGWSRRRARRVRQQLATSASQQEQQLYSWRHSWHKLRNRLRPVPRRNSLLKRQVDYTATPQARLFEGAGRYPGGGRRVV